MCSRSAGYTRIGSSAEITLHLLRFRPEHPHHQIVPRAMGTEDTERIGVRAVQERSDFIGIERMNGKGTHGGEKQTNGGGRQCNRIGPWGLSSTFWEATSPSWASAPFKTARSRLEDPAGSGGEVGLGRSDIFLQAVRHAFVYSPLAPRKPPKAKHALV